jgi:hypothetical protein
MINGLYHDMPNEDYHGRFSYEKDGWISSSLLKAAMGGWQSYEAFLEDDFKQTPSMRFGTIVHHALLESDSFSDVWGGKLTKGENEKLDKILTHFPANVLDQLGACDSEVSLFQNDTREKVRFDGINQDHGIIFDVKTTSSFDGFKWVVPKYSYDLQAYFYLKVAKQFYNKDCKFIWVAVETVRPFRVNWFTPSYETLNKGEEKYVQAIDSLVSFKDGYERIISNELELI